jgi:hypothetical protein
MFSYCKKSSSYLIKLIKHNIYSPDNISVNFKMVLKGREACIKVLKEKFVVAAGRNIWYSF